MWRSKKRYTLKIDQIEKQIEAYEYHINMLNATVRQYCTKAKKMRLLALAVTQCDDIMFERDHTNLESGSSLMPKVTSDSEDGEPQNKVDYSYIDDDSDDWRRASPEET